MILFEGYEALLPYGFNLSESEKSVPRKLDSFYAGSFVVLVVQFKPDSFPQVVPVVARILTEMFSGELSWSTDSIRLQISNPDVKDQTVEQFKELQRLLQSQHIQGPWTPSVQ